jgi:hypothetical protein
VAGELPVIYTLVGNSSEVRILFIGLRNWKNPRRKSESKRKTKSSTSITTLVPNQSTRAKQKWTDRFIAHSGEAPKELLSYPPEGQYESIVYAFREGIRKKRSNDAQKR